MPSYFHNSFLQKVKNSNNYLSETIFSESTQMHVISIALRGKVREWLSQAPSHSLLICSVVFLMQQNVCNKWMVLQSVFIAHNCC